MDETVEVPKIDSSGQIIQPEKSRWGFLKAAREKAGGLAAMAKWAAEGVRRGYYKPVKPGEVDQKLENLQSKIKTATPITVDKSGNLVSPQAEEPPLK